MTSLAPLAHAADQAAPAFNADFYATAATVIPVLYLAINVQPVFQYMGITTAERRQHKPRPGHLKPVGVVASIVYLLMVAAIAGESLAIIALNGQAAGPEAQYLVLVTMILLTFAAGTGPLLAAGVYIRQQAATPAVPDRPASPEPDETDTA